MAKAMDADGYWDEIGNIEVKLFDGQHWEEAVKTFKFWPEHD